ncbi:MAG: type IV conjugative transfer system protein TraL [Gammaproteobacteria bacterium]
MTEDTRPIPKHLDDPPRLLFWSMDEIIVFVVPFMLLVLGRGLIITGILTSMALVWALRQAKQERGQAHLLALLYWHLPSRTKLKRLSCPSHIREVIG